MSDRWLRPAIGLGLLSCLGRFAIGMNLAAMPDIGRDPGAGVPQIQRTITGYFIAFGLAQLLFWPVDRSGRAQAAAASRDCRFCRGTGDLHRCADHRLADAGAWVQVFGGAALMLAVGPFLDGSVGPMPGAIALCGALAFGPLRLVGGRQAVVVSRWG